MSTGSDEGMVVELFGGPRDGETHWFAMTSLSLIVPGGRYVRRSDTQGRPIAVWEVL